MNSNELRDMINRYKSQMLQTYGKAVPAVAAVDDTTTLPIIETYQQFLDNNPKTGTLKVQVFTAQQALPIENVHVIIKKDFQDQTKTFFDVFTDSSGIVDNLVLPAPDRALSEDESYRGVPYATYDITASHPEYQEVNLEQITIFDGVKSIQPINLVPKR